MRSNGVIYQTILTTTPTTGGRAVFIFTAPEAGDYAVQGLVDAAEAGEDSFFVNVDAEPTDPYMVCDIPITSGFEQRLLNWRGNGTFDNNEFVPKKFTLTSGSHQLIIRGREENARLQRITIWRLP